MYKKHSKKRTPMGAVNWRKDHTLHSFATTKFMKDELNAFCKKAKIAKSELIRQAIADYLDKEEMKMAKKTTVAKGVFDWKGLVATLNDLDVKVPAARLSEFIAAKGLTVSPRSIASVRANLNR